MKKLKTGVVVVMSLALTFSLWGATAVPVRAGPAVVIKDAACIVLNGLGTAVLVTESVAIGTDSTPDISSIHCKATGQIPHPSGNAHQWDSTNWPPPTGGGVCFTFFGNTARWQNVVSSSGEVILSCHYPTNP